MRLGPALAIVVPGLLGASRRPRRSCGTETGPRSTSRRYAASANSVTPISCTPVSPVARHSAMALRTASSKRASDGMGSRALDQPLRRVDEQSRRIAGRVLHDDAPGRIRRVARDARLAERARVDPRRVTIDAHQRHRGARRRAIDGGLRREARPRPEVLVPPAAADPLAWRAGARRRLHDARDRLLRRDAANVERESSTREIHQVPVRVDQARQHGAPAEIESGSPGGALTSPPGRRTRRGHRVRPACRRPCRVVQRVDARIGENGHPANALSAVGAVAVARVTTSPRRRRC